MKKAERVAALMALVGIMLKLLMIKGAGFLLVISFSILSVIYMLQVLSRFSLVFYNIINTTQADKGLSRWRRIGIVVISWALSMTIVGILFKLQSFKGANFALIMGSSILLICFVVAYIRYSTTGAAYYKEVLIRSAIVGLVGLSLFFTPDNTLFGVFHRNNPALVEAHRKLMTDPNNKQLQEAVWGQRNRTTGMDSIVVQRDSAMKQDTDSPVNTN